MGTLPPPPPPPPLPTAKPPSIVANNGSPAMVVVVNGNNSSTTNLSNGKSDERQELMADIRNGVKLKAKRDQILQCSVSVSAIPAG